MTRAIRTGVVVAAYLVLWAPLVQRFCRLVPEVQLQENRRKADAPTDWTSLLAADRVFATRYEASFDDALGFRNLLVGLEHQADYAVFGENDKVLIGRDGWLFYRSVVDAEQYYVERMSPDAFERLLARLDRMANALARRGIRLVIVPCPMNSTVYPEMLPPSATRRPQPTRFDAYRRRLLAQSAYDTIDPLPTLRALKPQFNVFHKTDFHWTDPAAAHVARALVDRLGALSGLGPLWDQPLETETRADASGGEGAAMGLLWPIVEQRLYVSARGLRPGPAHVAQVAPNEWRIESSAPEGAKLLPPTVLFGDSFADGFERAGMSVYFRRLQKFYNHDLATKFAEIPPDTRFVVLEHIEPFLNAMASDELWPEALR